MPKKIRPKIGLALSGGSALGICHIGIIKSFKKNRIPVDYICGTSAGAIVAACFAFNLPIDKIMKMSDDMSWSKFSEFGYSKMGINSNRPIGDIIRENLGDVNIEDAKIPLAIIATDIDSGEKAVLRKGSLADAIMASTCLPGFFIPVEIGKKRLVDGSLVENLPLSPLREMGADIRIGVDLWRWRNMKKIKNVLGVILNSFDILTKPQKMIAKSQSELVIEPHLEKFSYSDFGKNKELIEEGFRSAEKMMPKIKKKLGQKLQKKETFWNKFKKFFKS